VTVHKHLSVLYAAVVGNRSHNTFIANSINFVITCWESSNCCLVTKIDFSTHHKSFLIKFTKNTFVSTNIKMLELTNDLVDTTIKLFVDWPRSVVNSFGERNFQDVSRSCSAVSEFVNIIDRNTIYMSSNMPQWAIKKL